MKHYKSVPLKSVKVDDCVFAPRIRLSIGPMLKAVIKQTQESGRIAAFDLKWKKGDPFEPHVFWDSDVAKVLEGMAYILASEPNEELEALYDSWVDHVISAQQSDGYLNTHFTVVEPEKRFTQLHWAHELYCAGHLIEAAAAAYEVLGKRKFLDAMCRYADCLDSRFGLEEGKRRGWPGHQELELALIRLYRITGEKRYLRLASYFIDDRGTEPNVFTEEGCRNLRGIQADKPFRELTEIYGHAVRAVYYCAGAADVAAETEDEELFKVCERLFDNMSTRRTYITGGIGSTKNGEAFTFDWDLPESSAYTESCAAIGSAFFAVRMLNYTGDIKYAEALERVLYNNALSGVGSSGDVFFYSNPIQMLRTKINPELNYIRRKWYDCSCCPTNYIRFLPVLGSYLWSSDENCVMLHIPAASTIDTPRFGAVVSGNYPAEGKITVTMTKDSSCTFRIRIPMWAEKFALKVKGQLLQCSKGYVDLPGPWKAGDSVTLDLEIRPRLVFPHSNITDSAGKAAIVRGPVVYALESCDNPKGVANCRIRSDIQLCDDAPIPELNPVLPTVKGKAQFMRSSDETALYTSEKPLWEEGEITAVPYYLWQNRTQEDMRIFIPCV